jgi:hypothetical protein
MANNEKFDLKTYKTDLEAEEKYLESLTEKDLKEIEEAT